MWSVRRILVFLAALTLAFSAVSAPFCAFAVDEADAGSAIAVAEERIVVCYRAVAGADEAGADTTALLAVLDEAGLLLSKARANLTYSLAYNMSEFDSAFDFALQSKEMLEGVDVEADVLRDAAVQQRYWDFMVNIAGSLVGAMVVVCGGLVVWFLLKRKYEKAGRVV